VGTILLSVSWGSGRRGGWSRLPRLLPGLRQNAVVADGAAFVSTSVSSEQIVGTVGAAYKHGMGIANWKWWCLPTYALVMIFFIPLY